MKEFFSNNYYSVVYCTYFAAAVVFSFLIYSLLLRFVKTLGIRNNDDGTIIRWGSMSKPAIGGIGFYIVFLLSVASYSTFFASNETLHNSSFIGLLLSMAAGFLIGLADDAYNTRPLLKFSVQVLCGVILIASGVHINFFEQNIFNYLLTLLWVVGIMNSINMLDNMDGITTIVSIAIVEAAIFITLMHYDVTSINLIILVGLLSSLIAFLYYNWNPSRMYMGDTGSQFLGVFLAYIGIVYFWNDEYSNAPISHGKQVIITLLAFLLPVIDTTTVVINRLSKGQSPFVGGKDHTTHSLAYLGLSDRAVAFVFMIISFVSVALLLVIKYQYTEWTWSHTLWFSSYILAMFLFFFITSRLNKSKKEKSPQSASPKLEPTHS